MKNTQIPEFVHLLRSLAASFLVAGVVLGGSGAFASVTAELTGQGSRVMIPSIHDGKITMVRAVLRPAAPAPIAKEVDADVYIALGMLLLLTGCTFHGMWVACHAHHSRAHRR